MTLWMRLEVVAASLAVLVSGLAIVQFLLPGPRLCVSIYRRFP